MSADDKAIVAGEYVLGLLNEEEASALLREAATDPAVAQAIAFWQARLDPLTDALDPVPPTRQLWARIAADMERPDVPAPVRIARGGRGWRATAIASLLLAACLAAFIGWSRFYAPAPSAAFEAQALLAAPGSVVASVRVQVLRSGEIVVVPLRKLDVAQGRQMDLWAWPREEKEPVLLGAVSGQGGARPFPYPPREGTPVMITDERQGSAAPASPGPTLYAGLLTVSR